MVIDKIRKMSIKGVKLKSESFFSISAGVLELWRKNLRGADSAPPGPDRVKPCIGGSGRELIVEIYLNSRNIGLRIIRIESELLENRSFELELN